jgi:hypothetical protein
MSDVKQWMTTAVCKGCNAVGTIRPIQYGFSTAEMADNQDIVLGGCCVTDNDPDYACKACHWECTRDPVSGELIGYPFEI